MFHSRDSTILLVCDTGLYLEENDIGFITVAICGGYISKYPRLIGDEPLSKLMVTQFSDIYIYIYGTRERWVNFINWNFTEVSSIYFITPHPLLEMQGNKYFEFVDLPKILVTSNHFQRKYVLIHAYFGPNFLTFQQVSNRPKKISRNNRKCHCVIFSETNSACEELADIWIHRLGCGGLLHSFAKQFCSVCAK